MLLFTTLLLLASISLAKSSPILDLSQPNPLGNTSNPSAAAFQEKYLGRDIRRFMIIQDGVIVMDYQRDNVEDDDIYHIWSATKAITSMIIGTIISNDEYDLSIDSTLGEIFVDDDDWTAIEDPEEVAFKQNITIKELLTMTSGLTGTDLGTLLSAIRFNPLTDAIDLANSAGINRRKSLAYHTWDVTEKGKFNYLHTSNVLSYVIVAVTGMTPLEYGSVDVFPSLGIDIENRVWGKNFQGVESSFTGLSLTARDMTKIAQLYLQKGLAAPDKRLLSEEFVKASLSEQTRMELDAYETDDPFGYLWVKILYNKTWLPNAVGEGIWCGRGFMGQGYCFNYESNRVISFQRSNTVWDAKNYLGLIYYVNLAAFSTNWTFDTTVVEPVVDPTDSTESGAFSHAVFGVPGMVAFSSCLVFLWL